MRLCGYAVVRLCGCAVVRLCGFAVVGCAVMRLCGCAVFRIIELSTLPSLSLQFFIALHIASSSKPNIFISSGAAGGLGFGFKAFLDAELVPGVDLILNETHLEDFIRDADVVITGEGRLDGQTVMGKAPIGVAKLAKKHGKRVLAFSGILGDGVEAVNDAGIDAYFPILRKLVTLEEALDVSNASANLTATVEQAFRLLAFQPET